jgi:CDGSH-type Zn-finger protein
VPLRDDPEPAVLRQHAPAAGWRSGPACEPKDDLPPARPDGSGAPTLVVARRDASLELRGDLRLYGPDGRLIADAGGALLCRCGNSGNKPFCDGSHETVGFHSRAPATARDRLEAETPAAFTPNLRVPDPHELTD